MKDIRILFVSRKHPPDVGGMQNQSYNLINNFKNLNKNTFTIVNRGGNKNLPLFIPYSFFKALYLIFKNKITHLHLSDGVLGFYGYLIKKLTGVKCIITMHGLDVVYNNWFYQTLNIKAINKLDLIICVSNHTKRLCIDKNIDERKCKVIFNGVNPEEFFLDKSKKELKKELSKYLNINNLFGKKILITVGRLEKRKGVEWFISNVMPRLGEDFIYFIVGDGPLKKRIQEMVNRKNLRNRVWLFGKVKSNTLRILYNVSDLFIMPNISCNKTTEGFGIVVIEAGSCGLPVIASDIEGIKDAVAHGITGWLVKEKNPDEFVEKIKSKITLDQVSIREYVINKYNWEEIAYQNFNEIKALR